MARIVQSMNKGWRFAKTGEVPAALPQGWEQVDLPHTWNAVDGQDGGNDYWRGTAAYVKAFDRPALEPEGRAVLEFLGAAMKLVDELETPTLEAYGINKGQFFGAIEKMAHDAMESGSPQNTQREITQADVEQLYRNLW